jgi:hypothetical protein
MDTIKRNLRHLRRYTGMLFADPVHLIRRLSALSIKGTYAVPMREQRITEAVALWSAFYAESRFYLEIKNRLYGRYLRSNRIEGAFEENYKKAVQVHVRQLNLERLLENDNVYVQIFCMYMLLPEQVARRWLWHENIDFQSPESFLRRLTAENIDSLKEHYELSKNGTPIEEYPCFKDGLLNRVWNFFGFTSKGEDRMTPKSALAHDFLGFNIGFQKYSKIDSDAVANPELTSQFLSSQDRGAFEVNKETGGLYWLLYRTLRSNRLYNKDAEVKLGEWICPGFWFTMVVWFFLLVVSPVCLLAAVALWKYGWFSLPLLGVGLVSPILYIAGWVRENFSKGDFDGDYWPNFGKTTLALAVGFVFAVLFIFVREYFAYWVFLICLLFLVPYCLKEGAQSFWDARYIGKLLPALFLAAAAYDIWRHTQFWEFCWAVLTAIALAIVAFFTENFWGILKFLAVAAAYIGLLTAGTMYVSRAHEKMDAQVKNRKVETEQDYRKEERISYAITVAGIAFMGYISFPLLSLESLFAAVMGFVLVIPFAGFAFDVRMGKLNPKVALVRNEFRIRNVYAGSLLDWIARMTASNSFWFEKRPLRLKADDLFELWMGSDHLVEFVMFVKAISSEEELQRAKTFRHSREYSQIRGRLVYQGFGLLNEQYVKSILRGTLKEDLERAVNAAYQVKVAKKLRLETWLENVGAALMYVINAIGSFLWMLCYPFRLLWRGIKDLWQIWQDFNEHCPRRPDIRGSFR